MTPLIYIAGPYSAPDPCENTHRALEYAGDLWDRGLCLPVVPHLSHFWHTMAPRPYEDWMALDLELVERCDGLIRLPGESSGADREVAHARGLGMYVLDTLVMDLDIVTYWIGEIAAP